MSTPLTKDAIFELLTGIPDPEIPVVNIVELGIVRDASVSGDAVSVSITPTYSGCPAMRVIEDDIRSTLLQSGFKEINIKTIFSPPWTTDWINEETKEKLRKYGIAPPGQNEDALVLFPKSKQATLCPLCGSKDTKLQSEFSGTACKSLYVCQACKEPFEKFKAI